ncbi:AMP-binding protein [Aceticella autotrophica]|uniref:AMP-binding protein n=1 Tax=Aceticella autotrophica TaxID=2755338 RepID=A0A975AW48_9THEO|nr:AMP-binding protein [Aceticella autotrophica]
MVNIYGYPLSNQTIYVLNYRGELCPIGVKGELYIGGRGLAVGYLNNEMQTNNSFIMHPFLGRLYKTGDYGILNKKGYIEFLGRKDNQVKINGYRVELGEIENTIKKNKKIKEAVVSVNLLSNGSNQIVAYIEPKVVEKEKFNKETWKSILNELNEMSLILPNEITPEEYLKTINLLEKVSTESIGNILYRILGGNNKNSLLNIKEFIKEYSLREHYLKLIRRWLKELTKEGWVTELDNDTYKFNRDLPEDINKKEFNRVLELNQSKFFKDSLAFIKLCNENAIQILKGEETALNLLFPKGMWNIAENMYRYNPIAKYYNTLVVSAVSAYIKNSKGRIKILEVGAGTGGTSDSVLKAINVIKNKKITYTYTDLSTFFTDEAKRIFDRYNFINYGLYNIDEEPQSQGYNLEEYDIIIAANVLHDAKNIYKTMNNLKSLLKPNGVVIILEAIENTRLQMVSVAFIDGFSCYNDFRSEKNEPLLSLEQWNQVLLDCKFEEIKYYPLKDNKAIFYGQAVIIGRKGEKKDYLSLKDIDIIKYNIKNELPQYMIPKIFIQLEKMQLNSNGKIDRKNLPKLKEDILYYDEIIKPRNETEEIIYDAWKKVLKIDNFGVKDNFFTLGGDSLKAIKVISLLSDKYNVSIKEIFKCTTIEEIAQLIKNKN